MLRVVENVSVALRSSSNSSGHIAEMTFCRNSNISSGKFLGHVGSGDNAKLVQFCQFSKRQYFTAASIIEVTETCLARKIYLQLY